MLRIISCLFFLFAAGCVTAPMKWSHESSLSAKTAYELLSKEVDRCYPKDSRTKYFLNEIGKYQIKVYRQASSMPTYHTVPADLIYFITIQEKNKGSLWEVTSPKEKTLIEEFEKKKNLCP